MNASFKRFWTSYSRILKLAYSSHPQMLILVTLINCFWGLTNLPVLLINKTLVDIVIANIGNPNWQNSINLVVGVLALRTLIETIRSTLRRLNDVFSNNLVTRINSEVESRMGEKLNLLDLTTVESSIFHDRYQKLRNQSNQRVWGMISPITEIPNAVFTIISGLIPLLSFNLYIWIIVIVFKVPEIIANARIARRDYESIEKNSYLFKLWGWVSHQLTHSQYLLENKILGNVQFLVQKLAGIRNLVAEQNYERRMNRARLRILSDLPNQLIYFGLNAYFFILAIAGRITLGTAQMLYQAANTLGSGMGQLFDQVAGVYENYLFVNDLHIFFDTPNEVSEHVSDLNPKFTKGIVFKDVWFKYPGTEDWILKGVSFSLDPKQDVALVGNNGAGKTTLIKLLCGFYKIDKGEILIDGRNLYDHDLNIYRRSISALFQDFASYPFSAKESIAFGDLKNVGNMRRLKQVAKDTGIDEHIEGLPLQYDTPLSKDFEKGVNLSKGQWQKIGLARVLFRPSKLIILDEPTSNVDPEAEEEIFDKLIKLTKDQIVILISHRFSTVRRADKILLLEDGKITEQGTHKELMKIKGQYAHLFNLQAKSYQ